jgi:hypothetical protein
MSNVNHEVFVKFSVTDLDAFYDWLHTGVEGTMAALGRTTAGYDAFYTLVKDGEASRNFDPHLEIEANEAVAIAEALRIVGEGTMANTEAHTESVSTASIDRISAALNALYSE